MKDESRQVSVRASDGQSLTPVMTAREIVSELDRYIVGQRDAKRAVAVAVRNRWRRQLVPEELRDEIAPQEHHHDRPHRGREDRDLPAPRQAGAGAVHQGGGVEVHRGGLRRQGRGVHHPGPHGPGRQDGPGRGAGEGPGQGQGPGGRAGAGPVVAGAAGPGRRRHGWWRGGGAAVARDPGEAPQDASGGEAGRPLRGRRADPEHDADDRGADPRRGWRRWSRTSRRCSPTCFPGSPSGRP